MKKVFLLTFVLTFGFIVFGTIAQATSFEPIPRTSSSGYVTYRNSTVQVMIPTEYTIQETEFRAVWVSPLVSDIGSYLSDLSYKAELLSILDNMEYFNLNVIVFHVRIMNDALYRSELSPQSPYISGANFDRWDYLEWFIAECHRRGIEFHAWMNPYRIANSSSITKAFITNKYKDYPENPASKEENIILGTNVAILNPGEPAVRQFLVDTCLEMMENYNIDGIHFDDYFYTSMPYNADYDTYLKYRDQTTATYFGDWRREQVDIFIEELSTAMRQFNQVNNRQVQLGISPTGVWRNGNGQVTYDAYGNAITSGSNTAGQEHYGSYLYSNTKKWVDLEWIDYIIPQSYWSFELTAAPYADVVDWWAKIVRYKNVNLYTGMGLYRRYSGDTGASWETNPMEAANQVLYNTKHEEIQGVCIFNYRYLRQSKSVPGVIKIVDEYWNTPVLTPIIRTMSPISVGSINSIVINRTAQSYVLSFQPIDNAKKYAIYRSNTSVDVNNPTQLVGLVGPNRNNDVIFEDTISNAEDYQYAVVAVSGTGHTGLQTVASTTSAVEMVPFSIGDFDNFSVSGTVFPNERLTVSFGEANLYAGEAFTYQVFYSYNQEQWFLLDENPLRRSGSLYTQIFTFSNQGKNIYLKVEATNDLGMITSDVLYVRLDINSLADYFDYTFYMVQSKIANIIRSMG